MKEDAVIRILLSICLLHPQKQWRVWERNWHTSNLNRAYVPRGLKIPDSASSKHQIDENLIGDTHHRVIPQIIVA